jgi:hypothetical protein
VVAASQPEKWWEETEAQIENIKKKQIELQDLSAG